MLERSIFYILCIWYVSVLLNNFSSERKKDDTVHPYLKLFQEKVPRSNPKVARSVLYQVERKHAEYSLS